MSVLTLIALHGTSSDKQDMTESAMDVYGIIQLFMQTLKDRQ